MNQFELDITENIKYGRAHCLEMHSAQSQRRGAL